MKKYCRGLFVVVMSCLLSSCGDDDYHYPSVKQDFLTVFSNAEGRLESALADGDEAFRIVENLSGLQQVNADTAIRVVANYETMVTDNEVADVKLYALLQTISPVPLAADEFKEGVKT